jgi:hypothetical protein
MNKIAGFKEGCENVPLFVPLVKRLRKKRLRENYKRTIIRVIRLTAEDVIELFMRHTAPMRIFISRYHRHRFPAEIISHCV